MDLLERVQRRFNKLIKGMMHGFCMIFNKGPFQPRSFYNSVTVSALKKKKNVGGENSAQVSEAK